jgi:hypothetical protein
MSDAVRWAWRPQEGPQKALVDCPVKEIFFGGTRGGGKTDGVLGKWALASKVRLSTFGATACPEQHKVRASGRRW